MKTILIFAAFAALTPLAHSDEPTAATPTGSATIAPTQATVPALRAVPTPTGSEKFAYFNQLVAATADGQTGTLLLDAGCGVEKYGDGSFSDVTKEDPNLHIAYNADGTRVKESDYADITKAPESVRAKIAAIAKANTTKTSDNGTTPAPAI